MVAEKRGALIVAATREAGNQALFTNGCFVGSDGLAVFNLMTFTGPKPPLDFYLADKTSLDVPTLLHVSPGLNLAVVRFIHRPKVWLEPSAEAVPLNLKLAILDHVSEGPVAIGPVVSKVEMVNTNLRHLKYDPVLSIGAGLPASRTIPPLTGAALIDGEGRLRGLFEGVRPLGSQTLIYARAADAWIPEIEKAKAAKGSIDYPLPAALNPYDPASMLPAYSQALMAISAKRFEEAAAHVETALKTSPKSQLLHQLLYDISNMANIGDLLLLAEATKPDVAKGAAQTRYLGNLARARLKAGNRDGASEAFLQAIKISPKAEANYRWEYSQVLEEQDKLDEALNFRRQAAEASPENIRILDSLQKLLEKNGDWEGADKLSERIYELENLYRRP